MAANYSCIAVLNCDKLRSGLPFWRTLFDEILILTSFNLLLLTATITPAGGAPNLARFDPKVRLADYQTALRFYLSICGEVFDKIIFVENSNSDLSSLAAIAAEAGRSDDIEFISFYGLDYPTSYDRGYGECKLLDYAMETSVFVRDGFKSHGENLKIWKVTGRYIIRNVRQIVRQQPKNFELYCNYRNHPMRVTDMFLMAWTVPGYQFYLKDVYPKLKLTDEDHNNGVGPECLLRVELDKKPKKPLLIKRVLFTPEIVGKRAGDDTEYSVKNRWKYNIRRLILRFFPWVWI